MRYTKKQYLCTAFEQILGYGVMVTLQILVLPFLVRVRVAQQNKERCLRVPLFFAGLPDSRPFFNLLRKWGGLRPLSLAYSLRPDTFVPAFYSSASRALI